MKAILTGISFGVVLLASCGAAKWVEPDSWTLKEDGHLRASQRKEDFTFPQWKAARLDKEQKNYGVCLTPGGVDAIAAELSARDAKITQLSNQLSDCRAGH